MVQSSCPSQISDKLLWKSQSFVNGEWINAISGATFEVQDPGNLNILGSVADCGQAETSRAIITAQAAYIVWNKKSGKERGDLLRRLAEEMQKVSEDLSIIITLENGKTLADSRGEVAMSIGQIQWMSAEAERCYGDYIPSHLANVRNVVIKSGLGVCGIITPWNFPQSMIVRKVAAALAAGCVMIAKAPRETPYSSLAFAVLFERAGFPPGIYSVITTKTSSIIGNEICKNPIVRKISFTGSTAVGRQLMEQSGSSLKKCSFELGGNAPFIIFEDSDMEAAVTSAAATKFRCSGQVCIATNRILVQSSIAKEFTRKLVERVKTFKVGYGLDSTVTHGPLINEAACKKVALHIADAIDKGAVLLTGGNRLEGNYFEPTILSGGHSSMLVHSDETFGPLAIIYTFDTEEEAISIANDTDYGLAGYFFTKDMSRVWRVAEALNVGMVGVNGAPVSQPSCPFGGVNQSGYGREGSKYGMEEYLEIKLIAMGI